MPRTARMRPVLRRKGRPNPWLVHQAASLSPTGRKRDKWFSSKDRAQGWISAEERRLASYSDKARGLTDEEKIEAAEAIGICREHDFRLIDAVREKAMLVQLHNHSISVSEMLDGAIEQLRREKKSGRHIGSAVHVANRMKEGLNGALCSQLTTQKAQAWLDSLATEYAPKTLDQYRRYGHLFCEHARIRGGHFTHNPFADVRLSYQKDADETDAETIAILTPAQVKTLLESASEQIRPYFAILAFAGLRPSEAQRLRWSDFDGEKIFVRQRKGVTSTRHSRYVTITLNLRAWLPSPRPTDGKVYWGRRAFRAAVIAAKLDPWNEDALRHSYGSYWLALHKDENRLAQEMGNSPAVIFTNYRKPVSEKDARAYFKITP